MGALADALAPKPVKCKVGIAIDALCEDDDDHYVAANGSAEQVARWFSSKEHPLSGSAVRVHRRGECRCGSLV